MSSIVLENSFVKLSKLDLIKISQENNLIYYSLSDISSPKKLKSYVETATEGFK